MSFENEVTSLTEKIFKDMNKALTKRDKTTPTTTIEELQNYLRLIEVVIAQASSATKKDKKRKRQDKPKTDKVIKVKGETAKIALVDEPKQKDSVDSKLA